MATSAVRVFRADCSRRRLLFLLILFGLSCSILSLVPTPAIPSSRLQASHIHAVKADHPTSGHRSAAVLRWLFRHRPLADHASSGSPQGPSFVIITAHKTVTGCKDAIRPST